MWHTSASYGSVRTASHAGSWYSGDPTTLRSQIDQWMNTAKDASGSDSGRVKAVVGPHAGFRYSGPTAAYSYHPVLSVAPNIERVVVIGPSHHAYLRKCGLSSFKQYDSPFGKVDVDLDTIHQLNETGLFDMLSPEVETEEHSLEMHVPFIQHSFDRSPFKVVPIMAGSLSATQEAAVGQALRPLFDDPKTLFAVSTDFCHWGRRFGFDFYNQQWGAIHESITKLDGLGIEAMKTMDPKAYNDYQDEYHNTICGRHAVSILLNAIPDSSKLKFDFPAYAQSSAANSMRDSSVSYAAGVLRLT